MADKDPFNSERRGVERRTIYPAVVRDINDPDGLNRVKAVIKDIRDDQIAIEDIPWALPMSPRQFHVPIAVGDAVNVILADPDKPYLERYYTTKMVADFTNLDNPSYDEAFRGTPNSRGRAPRKPLPTFPNNKYRDLWIVGNQNADIKFNEGLVEIVGGYRQEDSLGLVNETNPAKIFVRSVGDVSQSGAIGDKIMLLANQGRNRRNPPVDLDSEALEALFEQLSPLPYGDTLVRVLGIFRDAIISHSHKYHNQKANPEGDAIERLKQVNLDTINSKNHRIN